MADQLFIKGVPHLTEHSSFNRIGHIHLSMSRSRRSQALLQFVFFCGILLFINVLANVFYTQADLTGDQRFTLAQPTKQLLKGLKERVYVEVLLDGEFPAGFKRLQTATREMLEDMRSQNGLVEYNFDDPLRGSREDVQGRQKALYELGIEPMTIDIKETGQATKRLVYPVAIFHYGNRQIPVNLIENNSPAISPEVINNSEKKLEYKFASAIKKILVANKPYILFTAGHGELPKLQTLDIERSLLQFYTTDRILLDSVVQLTPDKCALLIVAKPRSPFTEKEKFKIDQYVMQGGHVLWLIDRLNAELDSLGASGHFVPQDYPLQLEDMLFKYGVRIMPDLVIDLECSKIPLKAGQMGNAPQFKLFPWYYFPTVLPTGDHPIVKNLDRVELHFCSTIDTIRTKTSVAKTPLIKTSRYSNVQFSPVDISFEMLRQEPKPELFNKGPQTVGVLLEGTFTSNYENRVSEEMQAGLQQIGMDFRSTSVPTRMLVISDGDVIANFSRPDTKEWLPLGYNRYENQAYANKDLLLNAIEYLIDPNGVVAARSKTVELRLLDTIRAQAEKPLWQAVNIGLPLVFLGLFGFLFGWNRRRRYAREAEPRSRK